MNNILLVSPDSDNEALWVSGEEGPCEEVLNNIVPLGLATVAGLTPSRFRIDIWDELVHGRIEKQTEFRCKYDLVGVTGYKSHLPRCREIAAIFRERGVPVVVGGPGISSSPEAYRNDFDVLFIGEVELTWPQFLEEWEAGRHRNEYRQIDKPDLKDSPLPDWRSIGDVLSRYAMGSVQTTRGCPFDCEFCDVIYLFGRRSRHKPIPSVLEEVAVLQRLGMKNIFFADDEFIGNPQYAKDLLRQLIPLNNSFPEPLSYSTQLTMNLSKDDELLELMADANFNLVFIGIETPNIESLKETSKYQNVRKDLVADVHKILSYGIFIRSGIIVGFDHDGPDIFDIQYDFIQRACLPSMAINMLKAPLGTKLWSRLRQEGRVISLVKLKDQLGHARSYTNILPKKLTRLELLKGYRDLLVRAHTWESFGERIRNLVSTIRRAPRVNEKKVTAGEALRLCLTPDLPPEGRRAVEEIISFTERTAPFMMGRVKTVLVQFAKYRDTLRDLMPQIDRQIEWEASGKFPLHLDQRPVPIPRGFRTAFPSIFPEVYRRLYINLNDKRHIPEALTEVFADFLVRWGESFEQVEPYHVTFLKEIGDRTCAKYNGQAPQDFVPVETSNVIVPDVKRIRLHEDILKSVEEELLKFAAAGRSA